MNIIKCLAVTAGLAALAACGTADDTTVENVDANMMVEDNMMPPADMNMDANMGMNAADGMNATENAMVNDLTTNDADTNLANGM